LTIPMWSDLFASQGFEVLGATETESLQHPDRPDGGLLIRARKPV
jgi:hypothetical protein